MNESPGRDRDSRKGKSNRSLGAKSKAWGIAIIVLAVVYSLSVPKLNTRFGWNLPQIRTDASGNVRLVDSGPKDAVRNADTNRNTDTGAGAKTLSPSKTPNTQTDSKATSQPPATNTKSSVPSDNDLLHGLLREVSRDRYVSPEGLLYTPGSSEGHRLEHLRRHTKDDPSRPGSHGVFDGEMEGALKTIDLAYQRAKTGQRTTKKVDDGRTIYTVDMGGRVGFVGGRDGNRKRKPMARRVRIVLEGTRVITAYPM